MSGTKVPILFQDVTATFEFDARNPSLGAGTYGSVFRARRYADGASKAVKIMRSNVMSAITSEVAIYRGYLHPHLMQAEQLNIYLDNGTPCCAIIMEEGVTLREYMLRAENRTWDSLLIHQLVDALSFLQINNIIYGDIKPTNCIVYQGDTPTLKMTDYSLYYRAKCGEIPILQTHTDLAGYSRRGYRTYRTPEDLTPTSYSYHVVSEAMWALGVTVLETLTEPLDNSNIIYGIPVVVYRLAIDTEITLKPMLQKYGRENWISVLLSLFAPSERRPKTFFSLFFGNEGAKLPSPAGGYRWKVGRVNRAVKSKYFPYETQWINSGLKWYGNQSSGGGALNLAIEYYLRYVSTILLGVREPENYTPQQMEYFYAQQYGMSDDDTSKNLPGNLAVYSYGCLLLAQSVVESSKYEVEFFKVIGSISAQTGTEFLAVARQVLFSIFRLMEEMNGDILLHVPYYNDSFDQIARELQTETSNIPAGRNELIQTKNSLISGVCSTLYQYTSLMELVENYSPPLSIVEEVPSPMEIPSPPAVEEEEFIPYSITTPGGTTEYTPFSQMMLDAAMLPQVGGTPNERGLSPPSWVNSPEFM